MTVRFRSFDEAWAWFAAGGEVQPPGAWLEGFTRGRAQFLAFIAPVPPPVAAHAADLLDALDHGGLMAPSLAGHLHITLRGAGFQVIEKTRPDEVLRQDVGRIGEAAARALRVVAPLELLAGPVNVFPDALVLEVHPREPLAALRACLAPSQPDDHALALTEDTYLPHVTIATFASREAGDALRERIAAVRYRPPALFTLRRVEFVRDWFTGVDPELTDRDTIRSYPLR